MLTCYSPLSLSITNFISGFLCESPLGWPSIFYIHAAVGVAIFVLWIMFYNDFPDMHRRVSCAELDEIHYNKANSHIELGGNVPVGAVRKLASFQAYCNSALRFSETQPSCRRGTARSAIYFLHYFYTCTYLFTLTVSWAMASKRAVSTVLL